MTARTEGTFTTVDGLDLRTATWRPPEGVSPKGLVILSHGLGEHIGRYDHVAAALVAIGFVVRGLDHRGHGLSGGLRGHVDGFAEFTRDLHGVIGEARAQFPDGPAFLFGHSMGGLVVLSYHLDHPDHGLAGLILSNPLLAVAFEPPRWKTTVGRALSRFVPRLRLGNEVDKTLISRDPEVVRAYGEDPLVHGLLSTRTYTSMTAAMERVDASASEFQGATLWILGMADGIVSAPTSAAFAARLPPAKTTVSKWEASFHEPHNDLDQREVIATIASWISTQAAAVR